jgi:hypothetical protein
MLSQSPPESRWRVSGKVDGENPEIGGKLLSTGDSPSHHTYSAVSDGPPKQGAMTTASRRAATRLDSCAVRLPMLRIVSRPR